MRFSLKLAAMCLAAFAAVPASAAEVAFSGDTTGGPTFARPFAGGGGVSSTGGNVNYQAISFTVSASGNYTFNLTSEFDNFLALYSAPFNPAAPLANLIDANDDANGLNAALTASLLTGTSYVAVATAFASGQQGAFRLTANGPGIASFGSVAAVPEPATWAMMLMGFGAMGVAFRRRRNLAAVPQLARA